MNKATAIKRFIFTGILLVLGFILAFAQFDIPFTHYTYNGFANSIQLGLDLKGGVLAVYEASEFEGNEDSEVTDEFMFEIPYYIAKNGGFARTCNNDQSNALCLMYIYEYKARYYY